MDGTQVSGADLWKERPLVLFFFASWCGECPTQQADITALAEDYGDTVTFLGIAGEDEPDAVAQYLDEHEVPYAVAIDDELDSWLKYAVREPPQVVIISKGGRVARGWPGGTTRALIYETLSELVDYSG
jgi:cytochrome c biogenesis protein CcmG/thiol:disulfide interchange protein DsbE